MNGRGSGWILFATIVLIAAGVMRIFDAIWMFRYSGAIPQNLQGAMFGTSLTTYAWIYLGVGVILIAAGVAVPTGSQPARWVGIVVGGLTAISAMLVMPYYPIWALAYIAVGLLVIYALAAYDGREARAA